MTYPADNNQSATIQHRFAVQLIEGVGILDEETAETLVKAFAKVPRSSFIPKAFNAYATEDVTLPIGYGQTITKPSLVARMLGVIGLRKGMRVLEIDCGSGYCSAVMAAAGAQVFAVENIGLLAQRTRRLLDKLNFQNILIRRCDGRYGWQEHAPYDAIVVSTVFETIEPELISQLNNQGGKMIAPIGNKDGQILTLWEVKGEEVKRYHLEPCDFSDGQ